MDDIRISSRIQIASSELRESFVRSTGPGGQNVNKLSTKVELRWAPASTAAFSEYQRDYLLRRLASRLTDSGDLIISCDEHRTQGRNREEARNKLAKLIQEALVRPKPRRATKPSRASVRRRLDGKTRRSSVKKNRGKAKYDE